MNTPRTILHTPETKTVEKEPSLLDRLTVLVNHVARSEEYRTLRSAQMPHTEAFSHAIDTILNDPNNGFNGLDSALLQTSSYLGTFIESSSIVDEIKDERDTRGHVASEDLRFMRDAKQRYIVPFNHSLKLLINETPNSTMYNISSALTQTYTAVFGRYNSLYPDEPKNPKDIIQPSEVLYTLKKVANGMRHEIAAETMLSAAGIEYDYNISVEEDMRGIDIVVYLDGKREPIDIKASLTGENSSLERHPDSRAVWTELEREDFMGIKGVTFNALSIPFSTAERHADSFVARIRKVVDLYNNRHLLG